MAPISSRAVLIKSFLDRDQCAGRDGGLPLLILELPGNGRNRAQVVGVAHQFTLSSGNRGTGMLFQVAGAEFSDGPVQVGKGVGGNLNICPDADEGHLAGRGMMDRLAVKCAADSGAEVSDPFRQASGHVRFDPVGFVRPVSTDVMSAMARLCAARSRWTWAAASAASCSLQESARARSFLILSMMGVLSNGITGFLSQPQADQNLSKVFVQRVAP